MCKLYKKIDMINIIKINNVLLIHLLDDYDFLIVHYVLLLCKIMS